MHNFVENDTDITAGHVSYLCSTTVGTYLRTLLGRWDGQEDVVVQRTKYGGETYGNVRVKH